MLGNRDVRGAVLRLLYTKPKSEEFLRRIRCLLVASASHLQLLVLLRLRLPQLLLLVLLLLLRLLLLVVLLVLLLTRPPVCREARG